MIIKFPCKVLINAITTWVSFDAYRYVFQPSLSKSYVVSSKFYTTNTMKFNLNLVES